MASKRRIFSKFNTNNDHEVSSSQSICETMKGSHELYFFNPDGNTEDSKDYVSVYLELVNHRQEVRALYEFSLLDQSGKNKYGALKIPRSSTTFEPESSLWYVCTFVGFPTPNMVLELC